MPKYTSKPPGPLDSESLSESKHVEVDNLDEKSFNVRLTEPVSLDRPVEVQLQRSQSNPSDDQALWVAIRNSTNGMGFEAYKEFIDTVLCQKNTAGELEDPLGAALLHERKGKHLRFGVDAYQVLKAATEAFLILRCGIVIQDSYNGSEERGRLGYTASLPDISATLSRYLGEGTLPYLKTVLGTLGSQDLSQPFCDTLVSGDPFHPSPCLLELIWSYWHEEAMLVQAVNAISLRFQNRIPNDRNPLTQLELSPLRPLSNILWGYVQDEPFRLTVARRSYEYGHQYGLSLIGKAVPTMRPADNRSKFLEAFHSLLRQVAVFYKQDADTTVIADGFPLLNSLQEVHMLLAEGAHNQFRDLPWTARVEMLIQKWLLSRQEMQEFLRGRAMVPYKESWMGPADTLRRLLGWGDTPVTHFRDLGVYGEQVLLSIRYGDWVNVNDEDQAKNWARYWKPEVQGYLHAYRAVTGVDLGLSSSERENRVDTTLPSVLLRRRLAQQGVR
ncbi:MAG TPA: hypothetical protein VGM86_12470 [Thermoanaerobaculia bacterium]|jgi:hypothetical protein